MIETRDFLIHTRIKAEVLETWIEEGWLMPSGQAGPMRFSEADLARAQLIRDLKEDLGVNDDGIGVVLDLLDQLHGTRRTLRCVLASIVAQPEDVRRPLLAAIEEAASGVEPASPPRKPHSGSR